MIYILILPHQVFASPITPFVLGNVSDISPEADLDLVAPTTPVLVTIDYKPVYNPKADGQYVVAVNVTNKDNVRDWASVVIIEIRGSNGVTTWLNWHSQIVSASSTIGLGMSWLPDRTDTYQIRTFVVSSLDNPRLFS